MKIAIFANTPAQLHLYKNIINKLEERNHKINLLARDYGETASLIKELNIEAFFYSNLSSKSKIGKILKTFPDIIASYKYLKKINPHIIVGMGGYSALTAALLRKDNIGFNDSELRVNKIYLLYLKLVMPFLDVIITPASFRENLGAKHLKVNSYKELAYLHPNYYAPNEDIFELLGIEKTEDFAILRFNAFDAIHDINVRGFSLEEKRRLVRELEKYVKVFISSEAKLPKDLQKYLMDIPRHRIHDVLYYAKVLVADTQTIITEAGILGTPAVRFNHFVGENDMGNFIELERKYKLIFNYRNPNQAMEKAIELVQELDIKDKWKKRKKNLLDEKIDLTKFMVWFIEKYPESLKIMKENPDIQYRFK